MGYVPDYHLVPQLTAPQRQTNSYPADQLLTIHLPDALVCFGFRQRCLMILMKPEDAFGPNFGLGFWHRDEFYRLFYVAGEPASSDRLWGTKIAQADPARVAVRGIQLFQETDGTPVRKVLQDAMRSG